MSTKGTILEGDGWEIYHECFEETRVHLRMDSPFYITLTEGVLRLELPPSFLGALLDNADHVRTFLPDKKRPDEEGVLYRFVDIRDLGDPDVICLRSPQNARVLRYPDGEFIAEMGSLNQWGSGSDVDEACADLKANILSLWMDLKATDDETLGKGPLEWKRLLEAVVVEVVPDKDDECR